MATLPERRLQLREMTQDDVAAVHSLAKGEQWPHRQQDLSGMLSLGTGIVAEMGDGEIVASTMWWPYKEITSLGVVIVAKTHRGAGVGRIVMEAALDRIGDGSIILNATEDGLPLYRKLGFNGIAEIIQHQGASFSAPLVPLEDGERIRPAGASDKPRISALVDAATGLGRADLMAALEDKGHTLVLDREGEVTGVAILRRFGRGYAIGPVVAPDVRRAKALVAQWLGMRSGEFIRLDIHGGCGLEGWLENLGLIRVGQVVTMVRGTPPQPTGPGQSFAIVSQALC